MPLRNNLLLACSAVLILAGSAFAWEPEEDIFGRLIRLNAQPQATDAAVIDAAGPAIATLPAGPYKSAAQSILGWRLLKAGKTADAKVVYESLLNDPAAPAPMADIARRWLTRLDREAVLAALQKEWTRTIRYPDTLESLPAPTPPLNDRWGKSWRYKTTALKRLKSDAQRVEVQSATLEADSDLTVALARPWAAEASLRPQRIAPGVGSTVVVFQTTKTPPETVSLSEGKSWAGATLVKVGPKALLLVEGDYVFLPLKPGI
jgi:hypothetical protein